MTDTEKKDTDTAEVDEALASPPTVEPVEPVEPVEDKRPEAQEDAEASALEAAGLTSEVPAPEAPAEAPAEAEAAPEAPMAPISDEAGASDAVADGAARSVVEEAPPPQAARLASRTAERARAGVAF